MFVNRGWIDGSSMKSTCCTLGGPKFYFQHQHDGSQSHICKAFLCLFVAPVRNRHVHGIQTHIKAKHSYIKDKMNNF